MAPRSFPQRFPSALSLPLIGLIAICGGVAWTLLGVLVAVIGGDLGVFWREWLSIQGPFDAAGAIFLGLLALSPDLDQIWRDVAPHVAPLGAWRRSRSVRFWHRMTIVFVAVVGTATTTQLGFSTPAPGRYFLWATCAGVCIVAGFITWHAVEVIVAAARIETLNIKFFAFSPGDTRSLKRLAVHFVIFGLGTTFGYITSLIGTLSPYWQGDATLVRAVQVFWPMIYVPICLAVSTYPHLAIHRVIRKEKDRLIVSYQNEINAVISDGQNLTKQDIERVNALADLIQRIEKSPSFAVNFPIALGSAVAYVANIGSLFVPKELVAQAVRGLWHH